MTAEEQLLLELTNRARLDPLGEAARFGISLNDGLADGTITATPKQVLAPNQLLERSAEDHSVWMLERDVFSHTGEGGSTPRQRMVAAGYQLSGQWVTGENLAFSGTTGTIDTEAAVLEHHEGLFRSAGHRVNTLNGSFRELGVAQVVGEYSVNGVDYNASMLTLNFGKTATSSFITGVVHADHDSDLFYDIGDGRAGVTFRSGGRSATSQAAGGYALAVEQTGNVLVTVSTGTQRIEVAVDMSKGNVKLDLVGASHLLSSANIGLGTGGADVTLIGIEDIYALGNGAANRLGGNAGNNILTANGGHDALYGASGADTLSGGNGQDTLAGDGGNDRLDGGTGNDTLNGNAGSDILTGGAGADLIRGGEGNDTATFTDTAALTVDLRLATAQETGHGLDTLLSVENVGGTGLDDLILGSEAANILYGNAGNDTLSGFGGSDRLLGRDGHDRLDGGAGNDQIEGGTGNDTILGGGGNDRIRGGAGIDTATFSGGVAVTLDLGQTATQNTGHGLDTLVNVENIAAGSGNDRLTGNALANAIYGNGGADTIEGGYGADRLSGGLQADSFIFRDDHGPDRIIDFRVTEADRLILDDALWSGDLDGAAIISDFARVISGGVMIDFGSGDSIFLTGLTTTAGLANQIDLI